MFIILVVVVSWDYTYDIAYWLALNICNFFCMSIIPPWSYKIKSSHRAIMHQVRFQGDRKWQTEIKLMGILDHTVTVLRTLGSIYNKLLSKLGKMTVFISLKIVKT